MKRELPLIKSQQKNMEFEPIQQHNMEQAMFLVLWIVKSQNKENVLLLLVHKICYNSLKNWRIFKNSNVFETS